MSDKNNNLSRRKVLGTLGVIGGAGALGGAGTSALFWDEEKFGNADMPNVLQAGQLDLEVDWEEHYADWIGAETDVEGVRMIDGAEDLEEGEVGLPTPDNPMLAVDSDSLDEFMRATIVETGGPTSQPPPVITLEDVKPGDFGEVTFSYHVLDNPGFVSLCAEEIADVDNGITEPEDKVNGHEPDDSDGDPFAEAGMLGLGALLAGAVPGRLMGRDDDDEVAADVDASATAQTEDVALDEDGDDDEGSGLGRAAGGAAAGLAGAAALSGKVAADSDKPVADDPDGDFDVNIDNGTLEVNVGELASGTGVGGSNWNFQGTGTMFRETYGFQDGTADPVNAEEDGVVQSTYPSSVSPGTTASATIEFPTVATAGGDTSSLEVDRNVTLDPNEATLRVDYEVTNTGSAAFDNLQISQYVDYDIGSPGGEVGEYFLDTASDCEFIFQEDTGLGLFAGFTGESPSANHDLGFWSQTLSRYRSGTYNNDDMFPDSGTSDVGLAFEWDLGQLAPGETTTFRNSFVYNEDEEDFETEICQESPGGEPVEETPGELGELVQAELWYDPNCDNLFGGGEVETMLVTDVSESMNDNYPGAPNVDGDSGDASGGGTMLEGIKAAVGDADGDGFLTALAGSEGCAESVEIGSVSAAFNLHHLDNLDDGDDTDDPAGFDDGALEANLDKGLGGATAGDYSELKSLYAGGTDFSPDFVTDDPVNNSGDDEYEAERPYTEDGGSTVPDGVQRAHRALLPDGFTGPSGTTGIDPTGNADAPGEARKLMVVLTDGRPGEASEGFAQSVSQDAEDDGIDILPIIVNDDPAPNDVDFAETIATTDIDPVFAVQYDGTPSSCPSAVTDAGHDCVSLTTAMSDLRAAICLAAGGEQRVAGPAPISDVLAQIDDCLLLDPAASGTGVSESFGGACHRTDNTGCLALAWWVPRDIPGVNDNIIQTDRYEFTIGFSAVQCRHNTNDDGEPIDFPGDDEATGEFPADD